LPERDELIVRLRFHEDLVQREIAARVGLSQMQVSRTLARAIDTLRGEG
jgi:RNA polymerase sigma-B factor